MHTCSKWDLSRSLLSFSSTRGDPAAVVEGGRLVLCLDGDVPAGDGKRSECGRSDSDGGVLGLAGRGVCLRRLCFGDVVVGAVGVNGGSKGDEADSCRCSSG